jgi:hypothetical protein
VEQGNNPNISFPWLKVFAFILIITLTTNLININYEVDNYRLEKSIDQLEEEKEILRAKYLSETSMSRLDYKATALKMNEISNDNCIKLSKVVQAGKFKAIKKGFYDSHTHLVSSNGEQKYLSGF